MITVANFDFNLNAAQVDGTGHFDFQDVFEFPDFIEMRPLLRQTVRKIAWESFKTPVLPVKVERATTALEIKLERETRKYARQVGRYSNQATEVSDLIHLYTKILQVISRRSDITEEIEDIIYAVNQTRLSLMGLPKLEGTGELYDPDQDRELEIGTYYYVVAKQLARPYLIDPAGELTPNNVKQAGHQLILRLTTYAYRDWDTYLMHEYDEQHIIKNKRGLSDKQYYDQLEGVELKYADRLYADVLADTFQDFTKVLVPQFMKQFDIISTDLRPYLQSNPGLAIRLTAIINRQFKVDKQGFEHVMDQPLAEIRNKYQFYRENFAERS
ncbi:hypothetical protein HMPREF9103_03130 [Lentilactobacillus parafarraginis F0439]|uniref:Uncharacterized protein n=1 Tax=Lentilactobacillus parafarraginis F0439 TaxID=797515 RepID=G9ZTP5_9LACO|nr:hypothetical protein HMPREF9103_03130 [Lentilactobacillus parafarraginis F0439]